jgi:hypothetical protein
MGLVDKLVFESRGAHGCSDSDYTFALTTCCERVGVVDDELGDFYWSSDTPSRSISLGDESACPFCGASGWSFHHIDELEHVPEPWRWACDDQPRPGRRRLLSLAEHTRELLAFCRRVASPIPTFDATLFLNTADERVRYEGGFVVPREALVSAAAFAPHFDRLLVAGYAWVNLSAYGIFAGDLIVGVEVPREAIGVPVGLTSVNYSGPSLSAAGAPRWHLDLTVADEPGQ